MVEVNFEFGSRLREATKAAGLTENEAAQKLNIENSLYHSFCNGVVMPSEKMLRRIAWILSVSAIWLITGSDLFIA